MTLLYTAIAYSQNSFTAIIKDAKTKEALAGATAVLTSLSNSILYLF